MKIFHKIIALFCCVILIMCSSVAVYAQPVVSEDLSQYTVLTKSYETNEVTSEVILPANSLMAVNSEPRVTPARMPSAETYEILRSQQAGSYDLISVAADDEPNIYGVDENEYPYCAIGRVETKWRISATRYKRARGTGCLEGPDVVLTCAHILWDEELGWGTETWFYPGQTSDKSAGRPIQSKAISISIAQSYVDYGTDDWAILQVEDDLGYLGWFGKGEATPALVGVHMESSGYRGDMGGAQFKTDGYVQEVAADYDSWIIYLLGVSGADGHSGAPFYDGNYIVWGIFNFGYTEHDGAGRAIDSWLYDVLQDAYLEGIERWDY